MEADATEKLPERIQKRLESLRTETDRIVSAASSLIATDLPSDVSLRFENSAPRDILTDYERAQSIGFIARFDQLPTDYAVRIIKREAEYYIGNLSFLRHVLNDFRPLIMNESDSIHYQKIHQVWYGMLTLDDPSKGTTVRAFDESGKDVTAVYTSWLSQHNQAISFALRPLEFDYLYNGVLQHSDQRFANRYLNDYASGELNYLFWKHANILSFIRDLLIPYSHMIRALTFPSLGPL
jgi:hypothetical protein